MPLHILLILVIGGIAGIALALHLLGLSKAPALTEQSARDNWLRHRPEDTVIDIALSTDRRAARVTTDKGRGILWQMGADTCARLLDGTEQATVHEDALVLQRNDYTAPKIRMSLSTDEKAEWTNWISTT